MLSNKMTFSLTSLVMLLATRTSSFTPVGYNGSRSRETVLEPDTEYLTRLMCPQPRVQPSGSF